MNMNARKSNCPICHGTGLLHSGGASANVCSSCNGSGVHGGLVRRLPKFTIRHQVPGVRTIVDKNGFLLTYAEFEEQYPAG